MLTYYASNERTYVEDTPASFRTRATTRLESDAEFQQRAEDKWKEYTKSRQPEWLKDIISDVKGETHFVKDDTCPTGVRKVKTPLVTGTTFVDDGLHQDKTVETLEDELDTIIDNKFTYEHISFWVSAVTKKGKEVASAKAFRENDPQGYAEMHNILVMSIDGETFGDLFVNEAPVSTEDTDKLSFKHKWTKEQIASEWLLSLMDEISEEDGHPSVLVETARNFIRDASKVSTKTTKEDT